MIFKVTLEAMITLPEGTKMPMQGRAFTLPNGDTVKPYVVLELNERNDMTFQETEQRDISIDEGRITVEAAGWAL